MGNRFYVFGASHSGGYEQDKMSVWEELYCDKGLDYVVGAVMVDSSDHFDRERFAIVSTRDRVVESLEQLFGPLACEIWHSNDQKHRGLQLTETAPQNSDEFHLARRVFSLFHPMMYTGFLHRLASCPVDVTHLQLLCDEPVTEGDLLTQPEAEKQFDSLIRNARNYATALRRLSAHHWLWFQDWHPLSNVHSAAAGGLLWAALNGRAACWEAYLCLTDAVDGSAEDISECWWHFVNADANHYIDWRRSEGCQ